MKTNVVCMLMHFMDTVTKWLGPYGFSRCGYI